jgi:rod shape determining protein RodA
LFERRLYYHIDWALLSAVFALCALGVVMIYSTSSDPTRVTSRLYITQLYAIALGLVAMLFMLTLDYRAFTDKSHLIYIGLLGLLVYVMFFGMVQMGARRWIPLKVFNLQPSEFAKVGVALVLAKFFGENRGTPAWTDLAIGGVLTLIPFALIAKEPDLGTAVTLLPVFLAIAYLAGMRMRILGLLLLCCLLAAPVAWRFALKDYQKNRISTFLDPSQDAKGAGYQQIQARITVGSGGLKGKGFKQGTQGQLRFLPVAHNDFIFSVLARNRGLPASWWRSACICS